MGAALALCGAALAQTVPDQSTPENPLNIPANLQVFGKRDPNVRKPTAIVNDAVITGTDVEHRMALIIAANELKLNAEEREALRVQILSQLVDETLQLQEARAADIKINPAEVDSGFTRVAARFQRPVGEMRTYLRSIGSSERSLRRQIEAEISWRRFLQRRMVPVNISDAEVQSILKRLETQKGTSEFHIKEIYLTATPEREQQVLSEARALMEEIKTGKRRFEDIALARSEASTRGVGGDLGWVKPGTLPEGLAQAASEMEPNQLAGPIEVPGGYSLIYLVDKRQLMMADIRDTKLNLRQLSIAFPPDITEAEASNRVAAFSKAIQQIKGCGDSAKVASALGAEVVDNASIRVRDLPPQLQNILLKMQVGESTPPFGSKAEGVRTLIMCGRDEPTAGGLPSAEQIRNSVEDQAMNLRADHKLRDLRRDAVIEYR
ncbi:peptidylprolyl isomerase [Sphingomonas sp.]|uniref:peptidylprolyl isomerase n=1 Tax=Sphingomonas sp. TaxID=28214 RepID=UPI001E07909A|nr:peptidylprolyl isomerase [Sphingomonas sp.]MBX9796759.1 peptidylprolyl isomerase [Sphingomonas sp.]